MKNNTDKKKFIELRAKGLSFSKISQEIDVSKPVLIKWNNELKNEIANRSFFDSEELLEKYHLMKIGRVKMFAELLSKAFQELEKREFKSSSIKELLSLITFFDSRLKAEAESINCTTNDFQWGLDEDLESIKIPLVD